MPSWPGAKAAAASPKVAGSPTASFQKIPQVVNSRPLWDLDICFVENTVVSIVEAFLLFKVVKLIVSGSSWWHVLIAFSIVFALVNVGVIMTMRQGVNQFEHIFMATLARLVGLIIVDGSTWLADKFWDGTFILAQMTTVVVVFVLAMLLVNVIGRYLQRVEDNLGEPLRNPGLLHTKASSQDPYGAKDPQEIAALGIMLSIALANLLDVVLGELVDHTAFVNSFPVLFKVLVATALTALLITFWHVHILPIASMQSEHFKKTIQKDGSRDTNEMQPLTSQGTPSQS